MSLPPATTPRRAPVGALLTLPLLALTPWLLSSPARAVGFSGAFDPDNWSLVNATNGAEDETLTSAGSPPLSSAAFYCGNGNDVACVENIDALTGAVDVVGSVSGSPGGGSSGFSRTTTWTVSNGALPALLSFDWALTTYAGGAGNQIVSYLVGGTETPIGSSDGSFGTFSSIALAPGETFGFRVTTTDNTGDYGVLAITNFNATTSDVPGPLPLAGGVAAYGWSRRLRRRIRQGTTQADRLAGSRGDEALGRLLVGLGSGR